MKVTAATAGGKTRGDFLFEIGCEEIPAGMILKASRELKALLQKQFLANGLLEEKSAEASIETFGAPRRLVAIARGVRMRQEDVTREITGPPKSVAYDQVGEPTRAAMSFAEKQGIPVSKLSFVNSPKGEYLCAKQVVIGRPAVKILGEVLPQVIQEISWPRSMYWTGAHALHSADSLDRRGAGWEGGAIFIRGRAGWESHQWTPFSREEKYSG
jgi:glycyl-tRNA synthetase beta subunit